MLRIQDPEYGHLLDKGVEKCEDTEAFQTFVIVRRRAFVARLAGDIACAYDNEMTADTLYLRMSEEDKVYAEEVEHFLTEYYLYGEGKNG